MNINFDDKENLKGYCKKLNHEWYEKYKGRYMGSKELSAIMYLAHRELMKMENTLRQDIKRYVKDYEELKEIDMLEIFEISIKNGMEQYQEYSKIYNSILKREAERE